MPPLIKVCGMRDPDIIRAVDALGISLMGFIFWPNSSRYVTARPSFLPTRSKRVGVFVNQDTEQVTRTASDYALDYIQLHGQESPDYLRSLIGLRTACHAQWSIIKAFNIATAADLDATAAYTGLADLFLFDTRVTTGSGHTAVGGTGQRFDWSVLAAYTGSTPFLLSGGIGPDDVPRLREWFSAGGGSASAKCIGIDLNSRFETAPGIKNVPALRRFLNEMSDKGLGFGPSPTFRPQQRRSASVVRGD